MPKSLRLAFCVGKRMGELSKMLAKLEAAPASVAMGNKVTESAEPFAPANGRSENEKVVPLFWSKGRFNEVRYDAEPTYDAAEEIAPGDSPKNSEGAEEELGVPFLKIFGVMLLAAVVVGAWHSQLRTFSDAPAPVQPAPVSAAFTPSATALQESAPLVDRKALPVEELPSKVDEKSWNDTVSEYEKFLTQQNRDSDNKQAANQEVLQRLENWMNGAK